MVARLQKKFGEDRFRSYTKEPFVIGLVLASRLPKNSETRAKNFLTESRHLHERGGRRLCVIRERSPRHGSASDPSARRLDLRDTERFRQIRDINYRGTRDVGQSHRRFLFGPYELSGDPHGRMPNIRRSPCMRPFISRFTTDMFLNAWRPFRIGSMRALPPASNRLRDGSALARPRSARATPGR